MFMLLRFIGFFCKTILIITCVGLLKSSFTYLKYCHDHNFSVRGDLAYNANMVSHRLADIIFPDYLQSEPDLVINDKGETLFGAACFIGNINRIKNMLQYNPSLETLQTGLVALLSPASKETLQLLFAKGLSNRFRFDGKEGSLVDLAILVGRYEPLNCLINDLQQKSNFAHKNLLQMYVAGFYENTFKGMRYLFGDKDPTQLLEYLIKLGADISQRDRDTQCTYLHYAVHMDDIHFAEVLLDHGIDWRAKDNLGCTALDYAYQLKNQKMIDLLRNPTIKKKRHRSILNKLVA